MAEVFYRENNANFLQLTKWQEIDPRLKAGFTTRNGGVSDSPFESWNFGFHVNDEHEHVIANRQLLSRKLVIPLENWVSGEQTHQTTIKIIDDLDKGKGSITNQTAIAGIDGLITNQQGLLCTAFYADCVPIFFFDPISGYIGIAHAGWKGTVNRMAEKMVLKLQSVGVEISNLLIAIGPCISQEKYEVDHHVMNQIGIKDRQNTVFSKGNNRYLLDLKQLNVDILLQSGVLRNNIDITTYCTFRDQSLFFSHRRDNGKTGRMLGYIGYSEVN